MKIIIILLLVVPVLVFGQIPVTDAATNSTLAITNTTLTQMNLQIKKLEVQLNRVNQNLAQLIQLNKKNNQLATKSKDILNEELNAKKVAPDYVLKSMEISQTFRLKDKIIEVYRASERAISNYKYLDDNEQQEFIEYAANAVIETNNLFKECKSILNTKSIILPEERLKKINSINTSLNEVLDKLIAYERRLRQLNHTREIRRKLIDLNN